jgi:hypothetical protein
MHYLLRSSSFYLFSLLALFFATSCDLLTPRKVKYDDLMPKSIGGRGEIMLIMDSAKWKGDLGLSLREVLMDPMEGLMRSEPRFRLIRIKDPSANGDFITSHHSVLVVLSLESQSPTSKIIKRYFSQEAIDAVMRDSVAYLVHKKEEFAKGQNLIFICGKNDEQVQKSLQANTEKIRNIFEQSERTRVLGMNMKEGKADELMAQYLKQHSFKMQIPVGFLEAQNLQVAANEGFILLRRLNNQGDKNLIISYRPYTSQKQFAPDSIMAWRDYIGKTYIVDPEYGSYMQSQADMMEPHFAEINRNNQYAVEVRALWRLSSMAAGGPFIGQTFVDEKRNRLYYIEGFVEAPQRLDKRELIRDVESLLWSFQPL